MNTSNPPSPTRPSLEETALQYVEKNGATSVQQLHVALVLAYPSLTKAETTDLLWRLAAEGKVELEYTHANASFAHYLARWENLGVYAAFAISIATILTIYAAPTGTLFVILRWILGSAFVLLVPGYVCAEALFPRIGELDSIERLALNVVLSLALVVLVGLILNYTPGLNISLLPTVILLTIVTIGLGVVSLLRKYVSASKKRISRKP